MANFPGTTGNDVYLGTADGDVVNDGGGGNDTLNGAGGNDSFTVTGGSDLVDGGVGADGLLIEFANATGNLSMSAGSGYRYLTNFAGTQVGWRNIEALNIRMGAGNDTLVTGNDGYDVVSGNGGDDSIDTGKGRAVVGGGAGSDRWIVDFSDNATAISLNVNLAGAQNLANGSAFSSIERLTLLAGDGADTIVSRIGAPNVRDDDVIDGGGGDDRITVGGGFDIVQGGEGLDTLIINVAADTSSFSMSSGSGLTYITDSSNTQIGYAGVERFSVALGAGNDVVVLGDDTDAVNGGAGNDDLNTLKGSAVVNGGGGTDRWRADFSESAAALSLNINLATSTPQAGSSVVGIEMLTLQGSRLNDVITSVIGDPDLRLDDDIDGLDGDDVISVGGGYDLVDGGLGNDVLIVDYAADDQNFAMTVSADRTFITDYSNTQVGFRDIERFDVRLGSGNDTVVTGDGADRVSGGAGNDDLDTRLGAAVVDGGAGTDRWRADFTDATAAFSLDVNLASSGPLAGTTVAGIEAVTLRLGTGADTVVTNVGAPDARYDDDVSAGGGADTITVGGGYDTVDGGVGVDLLIVDYAADDQTFAMTSSGAYTVISDYADTQVRYVNVERFDVRLGSGNDVVVLGDDVDRASGGAGNDDLDTRRGAAVVDGGAGVDRWRADFSSQAAVLNLNLNLATSTPSAGSSVTGIEAVTLTGTALADTIVTKVGTPDLRYDDTVNGGAGDDRITVGGGYDVVDGGLGGADLLIVNYGADDQNFGMTSSGTLTVITDSADTQVAFRSIERFDVTLGSGNDTVVLGDGADTVRGGAGNDTLDTRKGGAVVNGGSGVDRWIANYANSTAALNLNLNAATNTPVSGSFVTQIEQITLTATAFNDTIVTITGQPDVRYDDAILAGAGDDTITVGGGYDTVDGGDGFDTLIIDYGADTDRFSLTTSGDLIVLSDFTDTQVAYRNIERLIVTSSGQADQVSGTEGDDTFNGGGGNDILDGQGGADVLNGGAGADTLRGGTGNDRLEGGEGADSLSGDAGLDVFVFRAITDSTPAVAGRDTIVDYTDGQDRIDLTAIDADTTLDGDQAFVLGALAAGAPGRLAVSANGASSWLVQGDVMGDGVADFAVVVMSAVAPAAGDFLL